ncbi:claret isoform a [Anaeramoeba ignava]|uniref:Claret isoform a n=1 Tax=Anaeramoeba ignava TaxID=1746090 RepID=A0A9Q0RCT6_ANAIG|nr:claret isoform a [Anaeramoeba ignava]
MNEIIFFGSNLKPKLIKNEPNKITKPIQFKFENENENENEKQIKQISSGYNSIIFLFENGKAIEYLNEEDSNENPSKIQIKNIQKITIGWQNEAILTKEGNVFRHISYSNPKNPNEFINISSLIEDTNDRIIEDIVSGKYSIYLLTLNQNVYGIGSNYFGQLGFAYKNFQYTEKPILMMKNVSKIFSGNSSYHVFLLNSNQELFGCGDNHWGQLGLGYTRNNPKINQNPKYSKRKGKLIGFGNNNYGQLGTGNTNYQLIPIQIELPKLRFNEDISNYHISCGYNKSFLYYSPPSFSNLEEDLIKLFRRKEFCDISFKTENGEIIEAHKLILKYRLNQNQNQIEKLQEIISKKSIKESNQIFEMIYSNNSKINPKLYSEIKEIINSNEKIEETMKKIYLNENEKDFIIERKEKQYKFPKLILIMRSELYRGMFLSVTNDTSNKVTDYSELSNEAFQIFEYWIYSNQIKDEIQITKEIIQNEE